MAHVTLGCYYSKILKIVKFIYFKTFIYKYETQSISYTILCIIPNGNIR